LFPIFNTKEREQMETLSKRTPITHSPVNRIGTVAYYALISRLVIWALAGVSHALIQDYDSALELILPIETTSQQLFKSVFGVFLRWDAFYFVHIAEKGYVFEQAHAFFPLVPALSRLVANTRNELIDKKIGGCVTVGGNFLSGLKMERNG
jgi:phosphatidylinositol glycan class V